MSDNRADLPDLPGAGTGIEYWRDGLERRMPASGSWGWRERVLVRVRSRHNEVLSPTRWRGSPTVSSISSSRAGT
jgi:hypothetical protein